MGVKNESYVSFYTIIHGGQPQSKTNIVRQNIIINFLRLPPATTTATPPPPPTTTAAAAALQLLLLQLLLHYCCCKCYCYYYYYCYCCCCNTHTITTHTLFLSSASAHAHTRNWAPRTCPLNLLLANVCDPLLSRLKFSFQLHASKKGKLLY